MKNLNPQLEAMVNGLDRAFIYSLLKAAAGRQSIQEMVTRLTPEPSSGSTNAAVGLAAAFSLIALKCLNEPDWLKRNRSLKNQFSGVLARAMQYISGDSRILNRARANIDRSLSEMIEIPQATLDNWMKRELNDIDVLRKVYRRGYALWESSSKLSKHQFAYNRVNSFIAGGRARQLDADLIREHAGFMGTSELTKRYAEETPGQEEVVRKIKRVLYSEKPKNSSGSRVE